MIPNPMIPNPKIPDPEIPDPVPIPCSQIPEDRSPPSSPLHFSSGTREVWMAMRNQQVVEDCGFVTGTATLHPVSHRTGRDQHPVYLGSDGSLLLWKRCLRGGWFGTLVRDRHWSCQRFLREMELTTRARSLGIPTSDVIAVAATPAGIGHRVEMLVRLESDVETLLDTLADETRSDLTRRQVLRAVAETIRTFHEAGFLHGDLNLMNILVQQVPETPPRAILVDLDPGGLGPAADRLGNLKRLVRSYRKSIRGQIPPLRHGEGIRFLHQVTGADQALLRRVVRASQDLLPQSEWRR